MLTETTPGLDRKGPPSLPHFSEAHCDYYSLKSGFFFYFSWETHFFLQRQFERLMKRWLGPYWRERLLDA